jgi:AAA family ATP:ADP antiporter
MIAMSKLFVLSVKESLDEPSFKLYLLPIETNIKLDVQTKLEGVVTGLATLIAGGLILMIQKFEPGGFDLHDGLCYSTYSGLVFCSQ